MFLVCRRHRPSHGLSLGRQPGHGFLHETSPMSRYGITVYIAASMPTFPFAQVFNASHMVPYDVPDVAHDMILRFMGVDFSAILEGSARIPSSVGDDVKPIFMDDENLPVSSNPPEKSPEETKAQWDGERSLFLFSMMHPFVHWELTRRKHITTQGRPHWSFYSSPSVSAFVYGVDSAEDASCSLEGMIRKRSYPSKAPMWMETSLNPRRLGEGEKGRSGQSRMKDRQFLM